MPPPQCWPTQRPLSAITTMKRPHPRPSSNVTFWYVRREGKQCVAAAATAIGYGFGVRRRCAAWSGTVTTTCGSSPLVLVLLLCSPLHQLPTTPPLPPPLPSLPRPPRAPPLLPPAPLECKPPPLQPTPSTDSVESTMRRSLETFIRLAQTGAIARAERRTTVWNLTVSIMYIYCT